MKKNVANIIVIGCGLHFRERYFAVLQKYRQEQALSLALVVDLESQKEEIVSFFSDKQLAPKDYLFLPEEYRNVANIDLLNSCLLPKVDKSNVDGVMICTEPKAHKTYALWAIKQGLQVFMDKPLTAFHSLRDSSVLFEDYDEILEAQQKYNVNFVLSCERRGHLGYHWLFTYLKDFLLKFKVPITFIDVHFGGGMWNMPDEFFFRENHPYKYGYGVLLHSGYHYVDLLMSLASLNKLLFPVYWESQTIHAMATNAAGFMHVINQQVYNNLLKTSRFDAYFSDQRLEELQSFGETDVIVMGQFKNEQKPITNFSLQLMQTSACNRAWHELPKNTYLHNGRMRQENLTLHVGTLCSIQVNSKSLFKSGNGSMAEDFTIEVINNANLTEYPLYKKITREELSSLYPELALYDRLNSKSRQWQLLEYLQGRDGKSGLKSHGDSIKLIDNIYQKIRNNLLVAQS